MAQTQRLHVFHSVGSVHDWPVHVEATIPSSSKANRMQSFTSGVADVFAELALRW